MNRRSTAALLCSSLCSLCLLFMACASDTTDPDARSAEQSVEQEAQPNAEIPAEIGEAAKAAPTRDLGQLERELADNRAKLRQLGVAIATTTADGEVEAEPKPDEPAPAMEEKTTSRDKDRKDRKPGGKAKQDKKTTTGGVAPSSPKPGTVSGGSDELLSEGDAVAEPAKSVQAPPTDRPTEQGEERCPLICSLADSTCELTDEICELADRHIDDDAYLNACERASTDCKQAREACLECLG